VALSSFSARGNSKVSPRIMSESRERSKNIKTNAAIQMVRIPVGAITFFLLMSFKKQSPIIPDSYRVVIGQNCISGFNPAIYDVDHVVELTNDSSEKNT
jgi:hypothetical protein